MKSNNTDFKNLLNNYISELKCSQKELSDATGITSSIIGRYRSGKLVPKSDSIQIERLIQGIVTIAKKRKKEEITKEVIKQEIYSAINKDIINFDLIRNNLNILIETLNINVADISRYLGYDPSYLSKIRNGSRKPIYINDFINSFIEYIIINYKDTSSKEKIITLLDKNSSEINNLQLELKKWFETNTDNQNVDNKIRRFLKSLNDFHLENYIKTINFDNIYSQINLTLPKSKIYIGTEQMRRGELDFLTGTLLSTGDKNLFMYNEIPIEETMKDILFGKKWMIGLALNLKKGYHLNIIHNLDRPFNEMMAGLELWIPLYMTGQITPYYFKNNSNKVTSILNFISDNYVLIGEYVNGYHTKARYFLSNNKTDIEYYQDKSKLLIKKALPVMNIYNNSNKESFDKFYYEDKSIKSNRKRLLTSLPLHTLDINTLEEIAKDNNLTPKQMQKVKNYFYLELEYINTITKENILIDNIQIINKIDFEKNNLFIDLTKYDTSIKLKYSYEQYLKHIEKTKNYKQNNYQAIISDKQIFNNIDIYINEKKYVVVSKKNNPNIHFVIRHEKLINAIENFIPPIIEGMDSK